MMKKARKYGYIAITSILLLGILILVIVLTLSLGSFLTRFNISSSNFKERSSALAEACINEALLKLSQNSSYGGGETIAVASDTCKIISVATNGAQKIISTQAQFQNAFTNLKVAVSSTNLSVVSWEELPHF